MYKINILLQFNQLFFKHRDHFAKTSAKRYHKYVLYSLEYVPGDKKKTEPTFMDINQSSLFICA